VKILENVIECYGCGTFLDISKADSAVKCPKCHSIIDIKNHSKEALAYAVSALLIFIILPNYPLITTSINGTQLYTTIIDTPIMIYKQHFPFVAAITFFTIIIAPLLNSIIIIFAFFNKKPRKTLFKLYHISREWGFIDIFMLSCIVSYIKLSATFQNTHFEKGFYLMIIYLIFFYLSNKKFDEKTLLKGQKCL
jgi:paraquat-inducible protein A